MNEHTLTKVWDPFVRIFHWGLVLAFTVAYLTGEEVLSVHALSGYVILGLLTLRLVWGFIGPRYARFSDFSYSWACIRNFIKDTLNFRAKRYLGHNPAGGAMVFLLIASLLLTTFTGLVLYAISEQAGPLAGILSISSEFVQEALEEIHEFFANFTLFLVFIHIAGVIIESFMHRENLARAMISGNKRALDIHEVK